MTTTETATLIISTASLVIAAGAATASVFAAYYARHTFKDVHAEHLVVMRDLDPNADFTIDRWIGDGEPGDALVVEPESDVRLAFQVTNTGDGVAHQPVLTVIVPADLTLVEWLIASGAKWYLSQGTFVCREFLDGTDGERIATRQLTRTADPMYPQSRAGPAYLFWVGFKAPASGSVPMRLKVESPNLVPASRPEVTREIVVEVGAPTTPAAV